MQLGEFRLAVSDFSVAIECDPNDALAWNERGVAYGYTNQWEFARRDASKAIALNPQAALYYSNRGYATARLARAQQAIEDFDAALKLDPEHLSSLMERAGARAELGQWSSVEQDYAHAVKISPEFADAWNSLGVSMLRQRRFEQAEQAYSRAIELNGQNPLFRRNRAALKAEQQQWTAANDDYAVCIAMEGSASVNFVEAALSAFASMKSDDLQKIAAQMRKRFEKSDELTVVLDRTVVSLLAGPDDELRMLLPLMIPAATKAPTGRQAVLAAFTCLRLGEAAQGIKLLDEAGETSTADAVVAESVRALEFISKNDLVAARAAIEKGEEWLLALSNPAAPPHQVFESSGPVGCLENGLCSGPKRQ